MSTGDTYHNNFYGDATLAIARDKARARAQTFKQSLSPEAARYLAELPGLLQADQPGHLAIEGALGRIENGEPGGGKLLERATKGVELTGKVADVVAKLIPLLG